MLSNGNLILTLANLEKKIQHLYLIRFRLRNGLYKQDNQTPSPRKTVKIISNMCLYEMRADLVGHTKETSYSYYNSNPFVGVHVFLETSGV